MEIDAVIRVREGVEIVVLHAREVELVEQRERALHVHVVVAGAVHHQEADIALEAGHVADCGIFVAAGVVLGGVHIPFSIYGVCEIVSVVDGG